MKKMTVQTLLVLVLGVGMGYVAAAGRFALTPTAMAATADDGARSGRTCEGSLSAATTGNCFRRAGRSAMLAMATTGVVTTSACAAQAEKKPNILVIMGDDIGIWNLSTYHQGMMGYRTPNIDRLAEEGGKFMTYYAQQSCTAGRSAFITGQLPFRTGLSKVGLPGADLGIRKEDPTIAELLKPLGYMTGQFGKNHLGDKDEFLPTNHGFDEFFGNLYHLNAEEEPENADYPKNPEFRKKFGPRGVIRSYADGKIEDTGPLTTKRMETIDEEFLAATTGFPRPGQEGRASRSSAGSTPPACTTSPTLRRRTVGKTGPGLLRRRHGRTRRPRRQAAQDRGRSRADQQHDRHLPDRQRPDGLPVPGCRHHALPRREKHELGRRLARARAHPLAGHGQARYRVHRHLRGRGLAAHSAGRRR